MEMNNNSLLWFFAILFLAGGNGNFFGNHGPVPMGPPPATQQDVNEAVNNQSVQNQLSDIRVATANTNLETAKAFAEQNAFMQNQQNANMVNVIQGFNNLSQRIDQLGFKMDACCCEIKTQMLQQQLDQARANEVRLQNQLDNRDQTQILLNNLGRFVAWAGSGSQAGVVAAAG